MNNRTYIWHGVIPILAASVLWAFGYFARKIILFDVSPITLSTLNTIIVALFIALVFQPNLRSIKNIFIAHFWQFLGLSLSGVVLGTTLMYLALSHLDLGITTLLEKLQPVFIPLLAYYFLKEKISAKVIPYCIAALIAAYAVSTPDFLHFSLKKTDLVGILAAAGAAFAWAVASVLGRSLLLKDISPQDVMFIRFSLGGFLLLPFFFYENGLVPHLEISPFVQAIIIVSAVISTGCGYLLGYKGLKNVDTTTAGFLELVTPIVSLILGMAFLHENMTNLQIIAVPILLYCVYKISMNRPIRQPEEMEQS